MSDTGSAAPQGRVDGNPATRSRYALLVVCAAVAFGVIIVLAVRRPVRRWWQLRTAYQDLASEDGTDQRYALQVLLEQGRNPDGALIDLLDHPSEGVRRFAAIELSNRPLSDAIAAALLEAMEAQSGDAVIRICALDFFVRHADAESGPLTEVEQRMIALLRPLVAGEEDLNVRSRAAMVFASVVDRDPTVRDVLMDYLETGDFSHKLMIACELASRDPQYRDQVVEYLLSDTMSADGNSHSFAIAYLWRLGADVPEIAEQLRSRRADGVDDAKARTIDQALELIKAGPPPQ